MEAVFDKFNDRGETVTTKLMIPMTIRTGMLRKIPIITGTGATNMINIHLKKLITKG